nr:HAD hydrolase-like protein [Dorea sp. AM58-8]
MKACIFDLDGTLTDTLDSLVYSVNLTLQEMGLAEISRDQCRRFVGNGARKLIEEALNATGDKGATRIEEGMQVYGRVFGENCTYHVAPYAGIPEALEELKDKGIRLAVLSNKPHQQTLDVVETFFGKELFDYVQGQMDGIPRKRIRLVSITFLRICRFLNQSACMWEILRWTLSQDVRQELRALA